MTHCWQMPAGIEQQLEPLERTNKGDWDALGAEADSMAGGEEVDSLYVDSLYAGSRQGDSRQGSVMGSVAPSVVSEVEDVGQDSQDLGGSGEEARGGTKKGIMAGMSGMMPSFRSNAKSNRAKVSASVAIPEDEAL
jgi:hypothetical protein